MKCKKCGEDTWVGVETCLCDNCKNSQKIERVKPLHNEQQEKIEKSIAITKILNHIQEIRQKHLDTKITKANDEFIKREAHLLRIVDSQLHQILKLKREVNYQKRWAKALLYTLTGDELPKNLEKEFGKILNKL